MKPCEKAAHLQGKERGLARKDRASTDLGFEVSEL